MNITPWRFVLTMQVLPESPYCPFQAHYVTFHQEDQPFRSYQLHKYPMIFIQEIHKLETMRTSHYFPP